MSGQKKYRQDKSFRLLKKILRLFKRKRVVHNANGAIEGPAIFVSNHSGASGPMDLSLYFPIFFIPWGTYQMRGNYKERWNYLYHVFYRQKLKYRKGRSWLLATLLAFVAPFLYGNMRLIRTYEDLRLVNTFKESARYIDDRVPLLIFPENSASGYDSHIRQFNEGFIAFAEFYYRRKGVDLPIYPVYYSKENATIEIDKPTSYLSLSEKGYSRREMAEFFRKKVNSLGQRIRARFRKHETESKP